MRENRDNTLAKVLSWLSVPPKGQQGFIVRLVIFWIIMTTVIVIDPNQMLNDITVGKPAYKTVICPKALTIVDVKETEALKNKARLEEPPVYESRPLANEKMLEEFDGNMIKLTEFYDKFNDSKNKKNAGVLADEFLKNKFFLDKEKLIQVASFKVSHFESLKSAVRRKFVSLCSSQIAEQNLADVKKDINETADRIWEEGPVFKQLFISILENSVRTNCYLDEEKTLIKKEQAAKKILPAVKSYQKGQRIVAEGDIVTDEIYSIYTEIQSQLKKNIFLSILGSLILLALVIGIAIAYIRLQDINVFVDDVQYKLIATLCFTYLLATKVVYGISFDFDKVYLLILLSPMATLVLLLTSTMSNLRIVYFLVFWMGVLSFLVTEASHTFMVALIVGSIGGILTWDIAFKDTEDNMRSTIHKTGINIGCATMLAVLSILFIDSEAYNINSIYRTLGYALCGFINGVLSGVIANGVLPYLENFYSFATPTKLLELTSEESPLLKRLAAEAPGTYQHSKAVANMAAQAASAVDADSLLTKVCALYHDIGKIKRPEYYTENQHGENPHDEKKPTMSALIIATHVKDGAELARDNKLPHRVIDVMSQHHGTTLIEYFYNKQKELTPDTVDESQFRYKGSKPQTKEAAILLLADAVEASSRSLDDLNPEKIKAHVKRIVDHKMKDDDQLEETNLTLKDIDTIEDEFVKVLISANHKRIKYQNQLKEEAAAKAAAAKLETEAQVAAEIQASAAQAQIKLSEDTNEKNSNSASSEKDK